MAITRTLFSILCAWTFSVAHLVEAQRAPATAAQETASSFLGEENVPGMAITISREGRVIWSEGFGYADLELKVPVRPSLTRFRVGSISKPITAYAMGLLHDRGRLDLDATVQSYVPTFPPKRAPVTVRLVAGHLGGIRHYQGDENLSRQRYETVLAGLKIFQNDPLVHPPGSKYLYSSYGWNLLSAVVEGASQRPFLAFMESEVFKPLRMRHTGPDHLSEIVPNRTRFYILKDGRIQNAPEVDNSYKWAGGGFLSTTEDLVRFGNAHLNATGLRPATIQLFWKSQSTTAGEKTNYGIGWASGRDETTQLDWVGHNGGSVGGTTQLRIFPSLNLVIAVCANRTGVPFGELTYRLARHWNPPTEANP